MRQCESHVSTIVLTAQLQGPSTVVPAPAPGPLTALIAMPDSENSACRPQPLNCEESIKSKEEQHSCAKQVCLSSITAIANTTDTDAFMVGRDQVSITFSLGFGGTPQTITLQPTTNNQKQLIQHSSVNVCVPCGQPIIASAVFTTVLGSGAADPFIRLSNVELIATYDCRGKCCHRNVNVSSDLNCSIQRCLSCASINVFSAQVPSTAPSAPVTPLVPAPGFNNQACGTVALKSCRRRTPKSKCVCLSEIIAVADISGAAGAFAGPQTVLVTVTFGPCGASQTFTLEPNLNSPGRPPRNSASQRFSIFPVNVCVCREQVISVSASNQIVGTLSVVNSSPVQVTVITVFDCWGVAPPHNPHA